MPSTRSQQAVTLKLHKRRGRYVLDGLGTTATATLRARGGMRHGEVSTPAGALPISVNDFFRTGATLGPGHAALIRLDGNSAYVGGTPVRWSSGPTFRRYYGTVSRGADRITVSQPAFVGRPIRVEVVGDWPQLELVVLTACFAVMSRRRGDKLRQIAVIGATGHGPA